MFGRIFDFFVDTSDRLAFDYSSCTYHLSGKRKTRSSFIERFVVRFSNAFSYFATLVQGYIYGIILSLIGFSAYKKEFSQDELFIALTLFGICIVWKWFTIYGPIGRRLSPNLFLRIKPKELEKLF